ncbi:hypothetical protein [Dokdonia sp.]|uniref:hypothetical protein n=1 Tax=Dokdonia sp. TaxID=2024995 RepID=UPI0032637956
METTIIETSIDSIFWQVFLVIFIILMIYLIIKAIGFIKKAFRYIDIQTGHLKNKKHG